mmetsp:Transcript_39087/g.62419  ORF Transcript_39087/g.62419 Transcript_39087/m.62419 type:complete len:113 (+) Transcript_39087:114-452(+)
MLKLINEWIEQRCSMPNQRIYMTVNEKKREENTHGASMHFHILRNYNSKQKEETKTRATTPTNPPFSCCVCRLRHAQKIRVKVNKIIRENINDAHRYKTHQKIHIQQHTQRQ